MGITSTDVQEFPFLASDNYLLAQNIPNPFNGKTSITFEVPGRTFVSLKVYNMPGTEIAELAGKEYPAGKHTVEFDASNLPRGIYFYTMKADKFTSGRKMILKAER